MDGAKSSRCRLTIRYPFVLIWLLACGVCVGPSHGLVGQETPTVSELIEQLKSGDLNARRDAVYALANLGEKATPAVPALTDLIDDKDQQIWFQSTMALARIGPDAEAAIPKLLGKLGDRGEQRRYRTAYCLGKIGPASIAPLLEQLEEGDRNQRKRRKSLAWMGPKAAPAMPALITLLGDEDPLVRQRLPLHLEVSVRRRTNVEPRLSNESSTTRESAALALAGWSRVAGDLEESSIADVGPVEPGSVVSPCTRNPRSVSSNDSIIRTALEDPDGSVKNAGFKAWSNWSSV